MEAQHLETQATLTDVLLFASAVVGCYPHFQLIGHPVQEISITAEAGCNGHSKWSEGSSTAKTAKAEHQTPERIYLNGKLRRANPWSHFMLGCCTCAGWALLVNAFDAHLWR